MYNIFVIALSGLFTFGTAATASSAAYSVVTRMEEPTESTDLIGRWNITIDENGNPAPSWLEVKLSGYSTLVGYFVGPTGSVRPVSKVHFEQGKFNFSIPPQWEEGEGDLIINGELTSTGVRGTITMSDGKTYPWAGVKAPYLKEAIAPAWGEPIALFNGKDLKGWETLGGANQWEVVDGVLTNAKAGANLISEQKFTDFKLHVAFKYPKGSNSGIYLRGRYEVQIEDSPKETHPSSLLYGGIYGFLTPSEMATLGPDEWQTYDITLVGRMITVVANGKTIISNQEIPGITGGALDSNEGEPGPIYIQGDHGPVSFREITITPIK